MKLDVRNIETQSSITNSNFVKYYLMNIHGFDENWNVNSLLMTDAM